MRAWALARLGLSVAATAALTGCSDGDAPMFPDVLSPEGGPSEPEGATTPSRQQLGAASTMPAALRIAAITAAQENASAHYDFERGPAETADRLIGHNHAQRLGIDVDDQGAHVTDMGAGNEGARWRLGLRLRQVCRASLCTRTVATDAELDASRNRAVIRHVGGVDEWYVNGPLGIEQGFTIANRPAMRSETDGAPLVLEVDLSGDLDAEMQPGSAWVSLVDESGRAVARYSDLYARDAGGRLLDTSMVASNGRISLVVSDEGAQYPVEVDPLVWIEAAVLTASVLEDSAHFGFSVAIDGDYAVVGAPEEDGLGTNRGAVYVFERNYPSVGSWGHRKKIVPVSLADNQTFGYSVALSGDTLLIGVPAFNMFGDQTQPGTVYVHERDYPNPDEWGRRATLAPSTSQNGADFGSHVSVAADTAVVGAPGEQAGGFERGAAYVFDRALGGADGWGEQAKLLPTDPHDSDYFGISVAVDGDTVVIGALGVDDVGSASGAAYLFERDLGGTDHWGQRAKIVALDAQSGASFGRSVAISGSIVVVGADGAEVAGVVGAGAAYVFERDLGGTDQWGQRKKLAAADPAAGAHFGCAVAGFGNSILVAASLASGTVMGSGAAYGFGRDIDGLDEWGQQSKMAASDGAATDAFGISVAVSSDWALLGAIGADASGSDCGQAYLFRQRLTDGDPCSDSEQCASGFCVDDVCCDSECAGGSDDCSACSEAQGADVDGVCGQRVNGSACTDGVYCNGTETCADGACGESTGDPCDGPDDDEHCAESCDETASSCTANDPDGSSCADGVRTCQTGTCIGGAGTECTDGTECETSYCTDGVCCTESDCTPYRCGAAGDCGSTCTMSGECATGFHCDGTGRCVADGAPGGAGTTEDEGGCSCRLGPERRQRDGLVSLLGLVAVLGLRRRRRA